MNEADCFLTVSPQNDSLVVNFRINSKPYSGLLDSGASISLLRKKMLTELHFPIHKSLTVLTYGGGNRESSPGHVIMPVDFEGVIKDAKFHIVGDDCPCDIILGLDFCKTFNLAIDFRPREISITPKIKFKLNEPVSIPPNSIKVCVVKTDNIEEGTTIADPCKLNEQRFGFETLGGLVEIKKSLGRIMLANHTNTDLKLPRSLTVAQEEDLTEPDILERTKDSPLDWSSVDINPDLTDKQKHALKNMIMSNEKSFKNPTEKLTHSIAKIELVPDAVPIKQAPYRVPIALEPQIEAQISEMLDRDLIEPSDSPFASPINLIKKRDGSFRFTIDFRKINKIVRDVAFPIPRIETLLAKLKDAYYFSCLDLQDGFFNINLDKESRPITAIATHVGLFHFKRLPQGLKTSPSIFVSIMDKIFKKQRHFTVVYLDDLCIFSRTFEEHIEHIDFILKRIHEHQLVAKLKKCSFGYQKLKFLGHMISHETISPDPNKVAAIKAFIEPRTKSELRSFLGLVNYYKRLIKGHSEICRPLYDIIGEKAEFKFGLEQKEAFEKLKNALTNDSFIKSFDPARKTFLITDASKIAIAAILEQEIDGTNYVIEYASRTLTPSEKNYGSTELECLALVWSCIHLRHYLLGHHFTVITDNHALCWMSSLSNPSGRLARWSCLLNEYSFDIKYRKGKENCASDCLSRYPRESRALMNMISPDSIKREKLMELQSKDNWCNSIITRIRKEGSCKNYTLKDDVLYRDSMTQFGLKHLLCVPQALIPEIEYICHDAIESGGHLGRNRTIETIRKRFFWPTLYRDVRNYVNECKTCQLMRDRSEKPPGELMNIKAEDVFYHIGMDIVGPFRKSARGNEFILTIIDFATKYAEAIPMRRITSEDILQALFKKIFLKFGVPKIIQSDQGKQFTSIVTQDLLKRLGTDQRFSTAYYPQCNGLVERFNKSIVSMIRKFVNENHTNWDDLIDYVLWHYNTTRQDSTGFSPYELVFGREPVLLIDHLVEGMRETNSPYYNQVGEQIEKIRSDARENVNASQRYQKIRYDRLHTANPANQIIPGDYVLIKRHRTVPGLTTKLLSKYIGPFRVISRLNTNTFLIDFIHKTDSVNVANLVKFRFKKNAIAQEKENRPIFRTLVRRSSQNEGGELDAGAPSESDGDGESASNSQLDDSQASSQSSGTAGSSANTSANGSRSTSALNDLVTNRDDDGLLDYAGVPGAQEELQNTSNQEEFKSAEDTHDTSSLRIEDMIEADPMTTLQLRREAMVDGERVKRYNKLLTDISQYFKENPIQNPGSDNLVPVDNQALAQNLTLNLEGVLNAPSTSSAYQGSQATENTSSGAHSVNEPLQNAQASQSNGASVMSPATKQQATKSYAQVLKTPSPFKTDRPGYSADESGSSPEQHTSKKKRNKRRGSNKNTSATDNNRNRSSGQSSEQGNSSRNSPRPSDSRNASLSRRFNDSTNSSSSQNDSFELRKKMTSTPAKENRHVRFGENTFREITDEESDYPNRTFDHRYAQQFPVTNQFLPTRSSTAGNTPPNNRRPNVAPGANSSNHNFRPNASNNSRSGTDGSAANRSNHEVVSMEISGEGQSREPPVNQSQQYNLRTKARTNYTKMMNKTDAKHKKKKK